MFLSENEFMQVLPNFIAGDLYLGNMTLPVSLRIRMALYLQVRSYPLDCDTFRKHATSIVLKLIKAPCKNMLAFLLSV